MWKWMNVNFLPYNSNLILIHWNENDGNDFDLIGEELAISIEELKILL